YAKTKGHFGSIAGPIANRIRNAKVTIEGVDYFLDKNQGEHTLHGGFVGLGLREWKVIAHTSNSIDFEIKLEHLELGLPGKRTFKCRYSIIDPDTLAIDLSMSADQTTMCNLAPHPYFCLDQSGTVLNHELEIFADTYLNKDHEQLPTGEQYLVQGSVFDLRTKVKLENILVEAGQSFDHNFCFDTSQYPNAMMKPLARLSSPTSKIALSIHSNQRGLQVYTPHNLGEKNADSTVPNHRFPAICLEPQAWPDSPTFTQFPSILVPEGKSYQSLNHFNFQKIEP
ncbi:MAG: hypothetical protein CL916_04895, partial [Deltaproteobacteria bacterium]|nr:hypothetical protein [Deltaproteobacteria bacterium]